MLLYLDEDQVASWLDATEECNPCLLLICGDVRAAHGFTYYIRAGYNAHLACAASTAEAAIADWPRIRATHGGEYALLRFAGKLFPG